MVGIGGMALAAQAMSQLNRDMADSMRNRRLRRERFRRLTGPLLGRSEAEKRYPFERLLCSTCGYLSTSKDSQCPACKDSAWFDLASPSTSEQVRAWEEEKRRRIPGGTRIAWLSILLAVFGGTYVLTGLHPLPLVIGALAILPLYTLLARPFAWMVASFKSQRPHRWKLPVPLPDPSESSEKIKGSAQGTAGPIKAPFSGLPCLAWQACVLFDTAGDARPPEWVLQEIESTEFQVSNRPVLADRLILEVPLESIDPDKMDESGVDWQQFLLQRGLHTGDGDFGFFEARIEPGQAVSVDCYENPSTFILRRD